ncbi:MAG TPA: hypothetical protein VL122_02460 [Nitrospirota bacterium]|nr:hypothetical protein [Nitrospirota bacterium]
MKKTWHYLLTVPIIIGLAIFLSACSGGGGGGGTSSTSGGGGHPATVISGRVVDGFVAGATVTAYQVNADGTPGAQIGAPVTTDQLGNYSLNLGTYTGPVYLTSQGGTYIDAATGNTINLTNSSLMLSAIVPNASGNVTAEINPLTTMAANVALTLTSQGSDVATAAAGANATISNSFGLLNGILSTALLDLTKANCMQGASQQSADVSAILAGISQLAKNYGVSPPDLIAALIQDVSSDGVFDGLASGATISVVSSGTGQIPLSTIEGPPPGLTGLANAITTFMTTTSSNVCGATVDPGVISALSTTVNIFTPPPAPTGVQATSTYGAAIVSWNTVTLATSYNLYMATSTGVTPTSTQLPGFMSIQNVTSPSVISEGLASATYYFVVTAVNGTSPFAGYESAPSAEASTTITANTQWARTVVAGSNVSSFSSVAAASDGSVYAVGSISTGTYDFGNGKTATGTYGGYNSALVKYNSAGVAQWAQTVTAGNQSSFNSVAASPNGSAVYAAGYITGTDTYNFGNNVTVTGAFIGPDNSDNLVLVKYDSAGNALWAQTVTGTGINYSAFQSVAVALDGSVYAAGYIGSGTYSFGNNVTVTGMDNGYNIVLVKYDSSGNALWATTVTAGNSYSYFFSVAAASDGSVYAAGSIAGSGLYGFGNSITTQGASSLSDNVVLVKYDSSGNAQWAQSVTAGNSYSYFYSVAAASDGSVYAAGSITGTGTYNFGNSTAVTGAFTGDNLVLVKYDSTGNAQWAQTVTRGSSDSYFYGVSAAPDGSVYAAGYISETGTYNFGNGVIAEGTSLYSLVLVKYDSTGLAQWGQTVVGGNDGSILSGVSVATDNTVYAAGSIFGTGTYNFGNNVTAAGTCLNDNIALVKYNGFGSISLSW